MLVINFRPNKSGYKKVNSVVWQGNNNNICSSKPLFLERFLKYLCFLIFMTGSLINLLSAVHFFSTWICRHHLDSWGLFVNFASLHLCFQEVFTLILTELLRVCVHSFPDLMLSSAWHVFNPSGVNTDYMKTITSFIRFWQNKTFKRTSSKTLGALPVFTRQLNSVSFIRVWPAKCALTFAHQLVMQFWNIMLRPTFPIMPDFFCCCFHRRVWSKHCGFCELRLLWIIVVHQSRISISRDNW